MVMPTKFYIPWSEYDPQSRNGGIAGELGRYVAADLNDNKESKNPDLVRIFARVRDSVRSISMAPTADMQGQPGRKLVQECLDAVNGIFEVIVDCTHTDASNFFEWCHAIPPNNGFAQGPIRFPLRNDFASEFVHYGIGTLVEVVENNFNGQHSGLTPGAAEKLIAPLYNWKATVMKHYFDLEVAGEISRAEMAELFDGKFRPGPVVSPPDESAERADGAAVSEALSGVVVMQWAPDDVSWATFGKLNDKRYVPERIYQPEGGQSATEDVAYEHNIQPGGSAPTGTDGQP